MLVQAVRAGRDLERPSARSRIGSNGGGAIGAGGNSCQALGRLHQQSALRVEAERAVVRPGGGAQREY